MGESANTFLSNRVKRILFVVFAFCLFYLVSYIIDPFADYWVGYLDRNTISLVTEWSVSFIFCFLIAEASIFIHTKLNSVLPWTKNAPKRLLTEAILNLAAVLLLILANVLCVYFVYEESNHNNNEPSIEDIRGMLQWGIVSIIISFMMIAINTGSYLINNWKNAAMEIVQYQLTAAEHKQTAIEAELQALKLQTDPHFVFNNLSVLSELILKDQQLGYEYAENFSKVYRYLLVNSKKDIITLDEELKLLHSYLFLVKTRIGEGVVFKLDIEDSTLHLQLPPLTLQILVENALKHNQTITTKPLLVKISSTKNKELIVTNTLLPLLNTTYSSGIGLSNIISRYHLLSDRPPIIDRNNGLFTVKIPLI